MTAKDVAIWLDGREYGNELSNDEERDLKAAGLVVVFGASDDLIEFRGAINDEVGAFDGGEAWVTPDGLFIECDAGDECPFMERFKKNARRIEAEWRNEAPPWLITTSIPHESFTIFEGTEPFCRGVVFLLEDATPKREK